VESENLQKYLDGTVSLPELCKVSLQAELAKVQADRCDLRVPRQRGQMQYMAGAHFHIRPELFLQLSGQTVFRFPQERMSLMPGGLCVMPRNVPHGEQARRYRGEFYNLVFCTGASSMICHIARANANYKPSVLEALRYERDLTREISRHMTDVARAYHSRGLAREERVKGALMLLLATMLQVLQGQGQPDDDEHFLVTRCRQIVIDRFAEEGLSVCSLAAELGCSADYLSNLFRRQTGSRLSRYINGERIVRAKHLLATTTLNITEAARACGYHDAGYFARVFRQHVGTSPRDYRRGQ
jgi:AraC-like DNA-binding protein